MGDKTEEKSPQKQRTGKGFVYEVVLLDGEHVNFELDRNAEGRELFDKVCQHLDLIEKDYFGLQFVDERISNHLKCWLSPDKKISKQKKGGPWLFDFALKFYPPDPTQLRESLTRWLVVLQTRRDILSGKLPATYLTQAMLGSYCVQADVGDYNPNEHRGVEYIRDTPFAPSQTIDLLEKIVELHRQHKGQTPDEAETNFLENAKKLAMYGVDLHAAQDVNNVDIMLGVCASGLQVYREKLRISRFVWPKILKISYKRRQFYIKVRPSDNSAMENSFCFKLATHRLAKRLWKICVEHHAFFRLREAEQSQNAAMFPRLGSKFRYSGRTLYQTRQSSQILDRPNPYFERSQPARSSFAPPDKRASSLDELSNRPDYWKDEEGDGKRRPSEGRDGKDRKDMKDDPNNTLTKGGRDGMRSVGSEEGGTMEPGANRSMDGKDRLDRLPGDNDATLTRDGTQGTMGLTPAELQKKAKEDEKERKRREKEEEKQRKKEEEERKKAEKAAKKGKGKDTDPSAEDRKDMLAGKDNTATAGGRVPGAYGDQEGGSAYPGFGGPGYGPGLGMGAGDMTGVVGEESWVDNKMNFEPIVPPKKETKDSLKSGLQGIDHTSFAFSPDATSTVGRPGKVPPPIPPKNSSFDDSFSRTDMYHNDKDGIQHTRVEHKVVLPSTDDEEFDYDAALADAIRSVTEFNPDMSVERIECVQQIEDVKNK